MNDWNSGYVIDVPYVTHSYPALSPAWMSATAVLHGQPPIDVSRQLTWVELGCGHGMTAIMVAATCPDVEVWACDFNPVHVEQANDLIRRAGLTNCTVEEVSFDELNGSRPIGPERVDMVAAHGVYSWIAPSLRLEIVRFLERRLVSGGLVHLSYNVPTGWASLVAPQRAIARQTRCDPRASDLAAFDAVQTIGDLEALGAANLELGAAEQNWFTEQPLPSNMGYVAHEMVNTEWHPMMFDEVLDEVSAAKCSYVGSSALSTAEMSMRVPSAVAAIFDVVTEPVLRECLVDVARGWGFRSDVFRRGLANTTEAARREDLGAQEFVPLPHRRVVGDRVAVQAGDVVLSAEHYGVLLDLLADGPIRVADAATLPSFASVSLRDTAVALGVLAEAGVCAPAMPGWQQRDRSGADALNDVLLADARAAGTAATLAAPAVSAALTISADQAEQFHRARQSRDGSAANGLWRHLGLM